MTDDEFKTISHLEGIEFMQELMTLEEKRFVESRFLMGSTFEDINRDFGIFPATRALPVYFAGDIRSPAGKVVVIGINPGFNAERYRDEAEYFDRRGMLEGCCRLYGDYFKAKERKVGYYSRLGGFLRQLLHFEPKIDWDWYQENLITLEFVPYHSANVNGLRINDHGKFRRVYLEILLKLLRHIRPSNFVLINGFPTIRRLIAPKETLLPEYADAISFEEHGNVASGRFDKTIAFFGLPFLSRPKGGVAAIVDEIRQLKSNL